MGFASIRLLLHHTRAAAVWSPSQEKGPPPRRLSVCRCSYQWPLSLRSSALTGEILLHSSMSSPTEQWTSPWCFSYTSDEIDTLFYPHHHWIWIRWWMSVCAVQSITSFRLCQAWFASLTVSILQPPSWLLCISGLNSLRLGYLWFCSIYSSYLAKTESCYRVYLLIIDFVVFLTSSKFWHSTFALC